MVSSGNAALFGSSHDDTSGAALDLADPAAFVEHDPHAYWDRMRRGDPVRWHPPVGSRPGFWAVARHRDVQDCYKDAARLSSARGTVLDVLLRGGDSAGGRMLAVMDRPRHRELRQVMLRAFSPRVLGHVAEAVRRRADALVTAVVGAGESDAARDIADHLPLNTVCDLLELPASDRPQLLEWNKRALSSESAEGDPFDALEARNEILSYFADVVRERRRRPGEDVISMIADARVEGEPMTEDDLALNCYSLILGGDESTRVTTIGALHALGTHEEQWHRLRTGEAAVRTAVEEVLRWVTPAMHFARTATVDLRIGPAEVSAGDIVTLWNISANNDPAVFTRPRRFDVGRDPNPHLALGHGPHFCLGAFLGRLELSAVLDSLVRRVRRIDILREPPRVYSNFLFGHSALHLRLD
ncbi:cytochrome P450 [Streptomyces alkaliterrae]|uniref:Cytochrome P450 n=1 Tax=Streptomyces alkaliterrae TaxID=2213162 RepID=A0A5P0YRQ1_9ACTN|nr:cytochrome P450 [Streptomyces alkaliterrae]MBB1252640.1 cytochrome P450 [Streptomyces alkaliterrae]MBB1257452.1 cytochrome P450 [Streptomyces alkaliterrae]MQS03003.1 cytochrome P450 [Streptomyces alkaliterrae]